jgi:flagellar biosynthesis/type III secretory pathway chaperone
MNQTVNQLLETLDHEMTCYLDMKAVLAQERDAATHSDKEQLIHVGHNKQVIVQLLKQKENRRQELVEQLANQYNIQDRPLTISRLCENIQEPYASRLNTVAGDLKRLVETVQQENNTNAKLFSHALELVHGSLKLLNDLIYSQAVYNKPGRDQHMQGYAGHRGNVFCGSV